MNSAEKPSRRILIAEDSQLIGEMIQQTLEEIGYEVELVRSGDKCLEAIPAFQPALIILDLMLPKVHGIDILKRVKGSRDTHHIGIIVCTAKSFKTELAQVKELGATDVIVKPFEKSEMQAAVEGFFADKAELFSAIEINLSDLEAPPKGPEPVTGSQAFHPQLDTSGISFKLWGTRGSIPISGPKFLRHGGNTTCMEIDYGNEKIIFDAGSGIRDAGLSLMPGGPRKIHLFITHTHWDHIQGFPFFVPTFVPGFDISIYGAEGFGKPLKEIFQGQLDRDYFPVQMEDMQAKLDFVHLKDEPVQIGDVTVSWEFTQHPGACLGYKVCVEDTTVAFIPDNEFLKGYIGPPYEVTRDSEMVMLYRRIIDFLTDVDVLIGESQYTVEEYPQKIGWGHSSISNGALLAKLANVRKWIVTHHDPMHDDTFLQDKLNLTRQIVHSLDHPIDVIHGFDGMQEFVEV